MLRNCCCSDAVLGYQSVTEPLRQLLLLKMIAYRAETAMLVTGLNGSTGNPPTAPAGRHLSPTTRHAHLRQSDPLPGHDTAGRCGSERSSQRSMNRPPTASRSRRQRSRSLGLKDGFLPAGPYRFPRNPQYVGNTVLFLGLCIIASSQSES